MVPIGSIGYLAKRGRVSVGFEPSTLGSGGDVQNRPTKNRSFGLDHDLFSDFLSRWCSSLGSPLSGARA